MASVFSRILNGELPGRFVWKDELCFAILTTAPIKPGHLLVIPREETDHWIVLDASLASHLMSVAQSLAKALQRAFNPVKVGLVIAGLEVPHVHLHVIPIERLQDLNFENQDKNADPAAMDDAAQKIRSALKELGFAQHGE